MLEVYLFPYLYPSVIEFCTLWSSASLEMQLFKISFTSGDFKSGIYYDEGRFLKISVHFQISYLQKEVGDPHLFLHLWYK